MMTLIIFLYRFTCKIIFKQRDVFYQLKLYNKVGNKFSNANVYPLRYCMDTIIRGAKKP